MAIETWVAIRQDYKTRQRRVPSGCLHGRFTEFPTQDRALSFCGRFCVNIVSKTQIITSYLNFHHDTVKQTGWYPGTIENQRLERSSWLSSLGFGVEPWAGLSSHLHCSVLFVPSLSPTPVKGPSKPEPQLQKAVNKDRWDATGSLMPQPFAPRHGQGFAPNGPQML